jgi:polyisoprenoid-binding protein YceI
VKLTIRARLALALLLCAPAAAAEQSLVLDPSHTSVGFVLAATLHTVRGELDLVRGELRFDPARGGVAGEVVLDARSARTGIGARDRDMHERVLESARFPEITLRAERLEVLRRDAASAEVKLHATLGIHGAAHPVAIPARVTALGEDRLVVEAAFRVPYVAWGMRDPSSFVLRVAKEVDVSVRAEATWTNR